MDGAWALPLAVQDVLAWAGQRRAIEVAHRALMTDGGVGAAQYGCVPATVRGAPVLAWREAVAVLAWREAVAVLAWREAVAVLAR